MHCIVCVICMRICVISLFPALGRPISMTLACQFYLMLSFSFYLYYVDRNILWKIVSLCLEMLRIHPTVRNYYKIDLPKTGFYIKWVLSLELMEMTTLGASWFDYFSVQLASQDCYKDKMREMTDDYVCFFDTLGRRKSVIKKMQKSAHLLNHCNGKQQASERAVRRRIDPVKH